MNNIGLTRVVAAAWIIVLMSVPAFAQIDLTGSWMPRMYEDWIERATGRDLVDYTGLPLNDEARALALTYSPTVYAMRERQCLLHSPHSFQFWPHGLRIWSETDSQGRIVAWRMSGVFERDGLTIWMDGRPHPSPNAFYPFSGFTTGKWDGDTLTTYTTHLKASYVRRGNGTPSSDQATVTAHFTRHDDLLTVTTIQEDPVYLTESLVSRGTMMTDTCDVTPKVDNPSTLYCHQEDTRTQLKFLGSYTIPRVAVQIGATFQSVAGPVVAANYQVPSAVVAQSLGRPLAGGAANVTVNLIEPFSMHGDRINQLDLRLAKVMRIDGKRVQVGIDFYNALNSSVVQTENANFVPGGAWRVPTLILDARLIKFSGQLNF